MKHERVPIADHLRAMLFIGISAAIGLAIEAQEAVERIEREWRVLRLQLVRRYRAEKVKR